MVRFNFISFALAAQGLQAVPSRPRNQLEPLTRGVSQPAQDAAREANKDTEKKGKEERKKAFDQVKKHEKKKESPHQDAHDTAQQIVDDGEDYFNKGKNEGVGDELLHG
ncbi:hypothetical protein VCV18_007594 [Metarhizium anisopliae]